MMSSAPDPKATKGARASARRARVAPKKAKAAKKASPPKKAPKGAKMAYGARDGSKTAKVFDLLKRSGGATASSSPRLHHPTVIHFDSFGFSQVFGKRSITSWHT
jgi:hypothetical protein